MKSVDRRHTSMPVKSFLGPWSGLWPGRVSFRRGSMSAGLCRVVRMSDLLNSIKTVGSDLFEQAL
jgi:hypothetical protein